MIAGALFGLEWPRATVHVQVLSQIFLRLIKVIIAPLLFSTLVSGLARHSDLKQLGRMGIKALIYFELITTAALFIGLGAINISRAGQSVTTIAVAAPYKAPTTPPSGADLILN